MSTSSSGSCTGSGRNSTTSTSVKMAVLAPIPKARVTSTTRVNTGFLANDRTAYRTSCSTMPLFLLRMRSQNASSSAPRQRSATANRESGAVRRRGAPPVWPINRLAGPLSGRARRAWAISASHSRRHSMRSWLGTRRLMTRSNTIVIASGPPSLDRRERRPAMETALARAAAWARRCR